MRISALLCAAAFAAACAPGSGRVTTSSQAPSTRVKALAIATVRGAGGRGPDVARALAKRLEAGGFRATALEDSDSVLAGSVLDLDVAANPRVLAEIARATGADAVVFLTMDDGWKTLDVAVLNLAGGDPLL
ncbi:MAG: hypothetical protein KGL74_06985, partial [Elusimicrobia bacterium]|nr:hypothetical protein [Elusimicrobiota bacterium]